MDHLEPPDKGTALQRPYSPLEPPGSLADKGGDVLGGLLASDVFGVINDPDTFAQRAEAQANIRILGQALLVPPANALEQVMTKVSGKPVEYGSAVRAAQEVFARREQKPASLAGIAR